MKTDHRIDITPAECNVPYNLSHFYIQTKTKQNICLMGYEGC